MAENRYGGPTLTSAKTHPAIHRLQRILDSDANRHEVAELLERADESDAEIPELLAFRAQERISAERMLERRRVLFAVGSMIIVFASVVGGFGLTTLQRMRSLDRTEQDFQNLVDAGQWEEASEFLASLDDETRSTQAFVEGKEKVDEGLKQQAARKKEFQQLVAELRAGPADNLDPVKVKRLSDIATGEEELETAAEFHAVAEEQRLIREAARADGQTSQFESLQNEVEAYFASEVNTLSPDERQTRRNELRRKLNDFIGKYDLSNPELTTTARQTVALLTRQGEKETHALRREEALASVTRSVGNVQRYVQSLERMANDFPSDEMTEDLEAAAQRKAQMELTIRWTQLLADPAFSNPNPPKPTEASEWLAALEEAEKADPEHPMLEQIQPWRPYFQTIAEREGVIAELRDIFSAKMLGRMFVYPNPDGGNHYSFQSPRNDSDRAHVVPVIKNLNMVTETKNFGLRFDEQVRPKVRLAGHSQYAVAAAKQVAAIDVDNFTPTVYRLINDLRTFQSDPQIDPIYQLQLMRQLLDVGVRGSVPVRHAFEDWLKEIDAAKIPDDLNWIADSEPDGLTDKHRRKAKQVLEDVDDWDGRVARMLESFKKLRSKRPPAPEWVGWIAREGNDYVALTKEVPDGSSFFAMVHRDAQAAVVPMDQFVAGSPNVIREPAAQQCGAMVFAIGP